MKIQYTIILLFSTVLFAVQSQAQTCFGNHALTDATGIAIDNNDATTTDGCFSFPAGPAGSSVSWVGLTFDHTFQADVQITISDGTTTVTLYNQTGGGADASGTQSFADGVGTSGALSTNETLAPVSGTLASLDGSQALEVCFHDFAGGDVYTNFGVMIIEYSDGSTCTMAPPGATQPTNDDICNATALSFDTNANGGADNAGNNQFASWTTNEPVGLEYNAEPASNFNTCATGAFTVPGNPGYTTWHSFTPTTSGQYCFAETTAFDSDNQMALFELDGTLCTGGVPDYSTLTQLTSSDDDGDSDRSFVSGCGRPYDNDADGDFNILGANNDSGDAAFCISLEAGTTYYLQVSSVSLFSQGTTGTGCNDAFSQFDAGGAYNINIVGPDPCATTCAEAQTDACTVYVTSPNDESNSYTESANNGGESSMFDIPLPADGTPVQATICAQYTHTDVNSCYFGVGSGRSLFEDLDTNGGITGDCDGSPVSFEVYDASSCALLQAATAMPNDLASSNTFAPAMVGTTYTVCVTYEAQSNMTDGKCFLRGLVMDVTPIQCAETDAALAADELCEDQSFTINLSNCFVPTNVDIPAGLTSEFLVVYDTDNTNTAPTAAEIYDDLTGVTTVAELTNFDEIATSCAGTEIVGLSNFNNDGCSEFETDIYLVPLRDDGTVDRNCKITGPLTLTTYPDPKDFTVDVVSPDCAGTAPTATLVAPDGTTSDCTTVVTGTAGQDGTPADCNGSLTYDFTSFFAGFPCSAASNTALTGSESSSCACSGTCEASTTMEFDNN